MARENKVARGLPGVKISENESGVITSSIDSDREFKNKYVREFLDKRELRKSAGTFQRDLIAFRKYTSFLSISPTDVEYKDVEDFADFLGESGHPGTSIGTYVASIKMFHTFLNKRHQMNMPSLDGIKGSNHANVPSHERKAVSVVFR